MVGDMPLENYTNSPITSPITEEEGELRVFDIWDHHQGWDWVVIGPLPTQVRLESSGVVGIGDCLEALHAIQHADAYYEYIGTIDQIRQLLRRPGTVVLKHVYCEVNRVADKLSFLGIDAFGLGIIILQDPPDEVRELLDQDRRGFSILRLVNGNVVDDS
ncbi:hypothetical protein POM88_007815 [Heracleum sosnowskyi]|uniref:Uncharacterized protein n=1 Tax=Heracleum sosnowskyi TaxID=360622 RepID=A0AAD8N6M7_9APIA|nr:hypothetical protein POM88_007815 [Heracleum sosnowskyi]